MVFVPKWHGRHLGAFGAFNRSTSDLTSDLSRLRDKCQRVAQRGQGPFTGKLPLDALRHQFGHAMQLDVIFQPVKGWFPVKEKSVRTHTKSCSIYRHVDLPCSCKWNSQAFAWTSNPVWGHAPRGALAKARRLCSTLNAVVTHGYLCDLSRDLARIAKAIWRMSQKDFFRLCRRISAKIAAAVRSIATSELKSPDPVVSFGALTTNPTSLRGVSWRPTSKKDRRTASSRYVPRYVPPFKRSRLASKACEGLKQLLAAVG